MAKWIPIYLSLGQRLGPKAMHAFHRHPLYGILVLLPFFAFIGFLIHASFTKNPEGYQPRP